MIRHLTKAGVLISTYLLVGCGVTDTVDTSGASKSDTAVIRGASRGTALFSPRPVVIKSVDGKPVNFAADAIRVSPGTHELEVTCYQSLFSRNTHVLTVSVEAGAIYTLTSQISPNKISDGTAECEAEISRTNGKKD